MSGLLLGRAPLFDDHAHPAAYRVMTAGEDSDGIVDEILDLHLDAITRGLPMLLPIRTADLERVTASPVASIIWAEPVEDELTEDQIERWRVASAHLAGIVLRDYVSTPGHEALRPLATHGHIVAEDLGIDRVRERRLRFDGLPTIATGVHTTELHRHCRAIGIEYVGGRYLDDVRFEAGRTVDGDRLTLLQLSSVLQSKDPSLVEVTALIERSPTLSFEVMRWINSAFLGLKHRVDDLRRAVGLLGPGRISQVVSLLLARDLTDRPTELYRVALVRARMCENIAGSLGEPRQSYYIAGLFSMLEPLLEMPLEKVLKQLPLTDEVVGALLHHDGRLGRVLQVAKLYEHSAFDDPAIASFDPGTLSSSYMDAIVFADDILSHAIAGADEVTEQVPAHATA